MENTINIYEVIYYFTSSYEFTLRYLAEQTSDKTLQAKAKLNSQYLLELLEWMEEENLTEFLS
jgi:hypothetical protein